MGCGWVVQLVAEDAIANDASSASAAASHDAAALPGTSSAGGAAEAASAVGASASSSSKAAAFEASVLTNSAAFYKWLGELGHELEERILADRAENERVPRLLTVRTR